MVWLATQLSVAEFVRIPVKTGGESEFSRIPLKKFTPSSRPCHAPWRGLVIDSKLGLDYEQSMKSARLIWVAVIAIGCASPALSGRPLTWEQVQRVGDVTIADASWKGNSLRLPIRIRQANADIFVALQFKGEVTENLICITASRDLSEKTPSDEYEVLIELPKDRLHEYFVVYQNPGGGYERLREIQIPETVREKLGREAGKVNDSASGPK